MAGVVVEGVVEVVVAMKDATLDGEQTQIPRHGRLPSDPNDSVLDENAVEKATHRKIEELDSRGSW